MADENPDGVPTYRPLPAVSMPLFRQDVRAARHRRMLAATALAACAAAVGGASLLAGDGEASESDGPASGPAVPLAVGHSPPRDAGPPPPPDARPPSAPPLAPPSPEQRAVGEEGGSRVVRPFGRARGFRPALVSAGLRPDEADAITAAMTGVLDFRRCRPEHEIVLQRDADGRLQRFEYRASLTHVYEALPDGGRWAGREVPVSVQRTRIARGNVVSTSLGAALEEAGLGRSLVGTFVETFESRIDFNSETRSGDAFRILVDEERVGGEFLGYGTVWALEYRSRRRGVLRAFWFEPRNGQGEGDFYDENGRAMHGGWLRTPLRYDHVSSPFNPRRFHPLLRRIMPHTGIDYAAGVGTPVWAAADGEVIFLGPRGANGNLVVLQHQGGYETYYAHLSRFASGLARGQTVRQRQVIGYVGSTGRSTGSHLHFALKHHGSFIDPALELNGPGRQLPPGQMARFRRQVEELRAELEQIAIPDVPVSESPTREPPRPPPEDATD
jgi:murein DD-endopeptidase MepM/ murein hydrolase activator NlpD